MPKCPGQDTYYWKPEDVSEAPCPACGQLVEFFKTDLARRCPSCGQRVVNPRLNLGCAQWCPFGEQCSASVRESGEAWAAAPSPGHRSGPRPAQQARSTTPPPRDPA
jgi:endogenous inhibitor of DNA gyrase (YacG/DUF329 family)